MSEMGNYCIRFISPQYPYLFLFIIACVSVVFLQPIKLNISRLLTTRSDRVKCADLHPEQTWMLVSIFGGQVQIWDFVKQV